MTFYLVGTGLGIKTISDDALTQIQRLGKAYLENYTVNFPYTLKELERSYEIPLEELSREVVEDESILKKAKKDDVALLVYGDALSATTHIQLILSCIKQKIPYKVFHNASIMTAIAATGLQAYKFGKTASMPNWAEHKHKPLSFAAIINENQLIEAHTLVLTDIGLDSKDAINQLQEASIRQEKIIILSNAGLETQKVYYDTQKNLSKKDIAMPFCIIVPSKMHFLEEEALEMIKE